MIYTDVFSDLPSWNEGSKDRMYFNTKPIMKKVNGLSGGRLADMQGNSTMHFPSFNEMKRTEGLASKSFLLSTLDTNHHFSTAYDADNSEDGRFPVLERSPEHVITGDPLPVEGKFGIVGTTDGVNMSTMIFSVNVFAPNTDLIENSVVDSNGGFAQPGDKIVLNYTLLNRQSVDYDVATEVTLFIPMEYTSYEDDVVEVLINGVRFPVERSNISVTGENELAIALPDLASGEQYDVRIMLTVNEHVTSRNSLRFNSYMTSIGPVTNTEYETDISDPNEKTLVTYDGYDIEITSITRNGNAEIVNNNEDLEFVITFSHDVANVDVSDFNAFGTASAGASIEGVQEISNSEYLLFVEHNQSAGFLG
ncbi:hypothetical protein B6A42_19835 [Vibrio coralliilyticus]|nr:hypothetical protein B6A42_19835 [Vibrio coralliilyticus]